MAKGKARKIMSKYAAKMKKSIFKSKKSEKKTEDGTAGVLSDSKER
jgi:hypothetical protein